MAEWDDEATRRRGDSGFVSCSALTSLLVVGTEAVAYDAAEISAGGPMGGPGLVSFEPR